MLCPLAGYSIDEKGARIVAGITSLLALSLPFVSKNLQIALLLLLILDFTPRAFSRPSLSLFSNLARRVLAMVSAKPHRTDAGPKRFAARIGLGMLVAMLACSLAGYHTGLLTLIAALVLCAFLESALGFCVGCWMWTLYWQLRNRDGIRAN
ncbi:MAG: hypothetical protein RL318_1383 [Fibrobacterota bacterium]|jgi:hypothetical protein